MIPIMLIGINDPRMLYDSTWEALRIFGQMNSSFPYDSVFKFNFQT